MAKILVVDDERVLVKGITFNLKNEGYQVETGYDGEEAVELAREGNFDLIILDLMMPKIDGLQACMRIREFSNVPIIMLTARSEDTDKIIGFECGADDYITKPFNILELKARVRALLRRAGMAAQKQGGGRLSMGHITLDVDARAAWKDGKSVDLTAKEFDLMELLLRNLGIRRVVLTGCMTDCCVINTAFDAANRDFRVVVPRDLTRGSEHLEEPALRMISLHLGLVVDSDALLDEWRSQK